MGNNTKLTKERCLEAYNVAEDKDGYLYFSTFDAYRNSNETPLKFLKSNPYTIRNIRRYIYINDIKTKLISTVYQNNESYMTFLCPQCNKKYKATLGSFIHNNQTRCKKCSGSKSYYEYLICDLLDANKIEYKEQHTFSKCRNKKALRFDFYLTQYNACIEADGIAHFKPVNFGGKSDSDAQREFQERVKLDAIKNDYCTSNNIPLLRIPYGDFVSKTYITDILNFVESLKTRNS